MKKQLIFTLLGWIFLVGLMVGLMVSLEAGAKKQNKPKSQKAVVGTSSDTKKSETDKQVGDGVTSNKKLNVRFKRITSKSSKRSCSIKMSSTFSKIKRWSSIMRRVNNCVQGRNWDSVEHAGSQMARFRPLSPWGAYYMSLAAEGKKHYPRALWMIDLALKKDVQVSVLHYQKARILWLLEQEEEAKKEMKIADQISDKKTRVPEVSFTLGAAGFLAKDCHQAMSYFKKMTPKQLRTYGLTVPYSECMAQEGQLEEAVKLVQNHLNRDRDPIVMLQRARLEEIYRKDLLKALKIYEFTGRKYAKSKTMKDWIKKKTAFLEKKTTKQLAVDQKEGKEGQKEEQKEKQKGEQGDSKTSTATTTTPKPSKRDVSGIQQAENVVKKEEEER